MIYITKCMNCDYIDYLEENKPRCPRCGSNTQIAQDPFTNASVQIKIPNKSGRKKMISLPFRTASATIRSILESVLEVRIPNKDSRKKLIIMIEAYAWVMLNREPQLWLHIDALVSGVAELVALKLKLES